MNKKSSKSNKQAKSNNLTFFLILVIILVVVIYHCNTKYKEHLYKREAFQNDINNNNNNNNKSIKALDNMLNKTLKGTKRNENNVSSNEGNSILPVDETNIIISKVEGDFNTNTVNNNTQKNKLYLDNKNDGLVLLPNGHIIIKFNKDEDIENILLKGFAKCRVDIANKNSNVYKQLFRVDNPKKLLKQVLQYSKENINQYNSIYPTSVLKGSSIKITNTDIERTKPIKVEIKNNRCKQLKCNRDATKISNLQLFDHNNNKITELLVVKENNKRAHITVKLPKKVELHGFKLKTNIPHFRISTSSNGFETFPKDGFYEGGKDGIKEQDYYLDKPVLTNILKIITFINPEEIDNKKYFINSISVYGNVSSQNIIEGFQNSMEVDDTNTEGEKLKEMKEVLLEDLQNSVDVQKACQALSYQEDINNEAQKLEQFKKYNLILEQQHEEYKNLERVVNKLREKRKVQLKKEDMLNVARYQKMRGEEFKVKDALKKFHNEQSKLNIDLNVIKKKENNITAPKEITNNNNNPDLGGPKDFNAKTTAKTTVIVPDDVPGESGE